MASPGLLHGIALPCPIEFILAARAAGPDLVGFEGAFGTRLLMRDAATPSLNFGYRGRVAVAGLGTSGSGLVPTEEVLGACQ